MLSRVSPMSAAVVVVIPPSIIPRKLDHLYSYKLLGPSCGLGWAVVRKFESPCLHSLHSLVVSCPDTSRDQQAMFHSHSIVSRSPKIA